MTLNLPANIPLHFVAVQQIVEERHTDKMASDKEVQMKQRCVTEFHHVEKMGPDDVHQCLLKVYENQIVDVSTVK